MPYVKQRVTFFQAHWNLSHVEQEGLPPTPTDRGAEQGDVDGPLECSLALGMVAAEIRMHVAPQQAASNLPWIGVDDPLEEQRAADRPRKHDAESFTFSVGRASKTHPN